MRESELQYQDYIARLYKELTEEGVSDIDNVKNLSRTVTFQVTDACNLACSYCYQINKGTRRMSLETAKKFVDMILTGEKGMDDYLHPEASPGIVFEFIGGEPFLEVELIDQICDYIWERMIELDHKWLTKHMFSICSNGVLYRDPKVQKFLNKRQHELSFSITIDGNKELHDSCRVFHDGKPSYDIAIDGAMDWMNRGNYMGSKITIAPGNISYMYDAITHMINMGYKNIHANTVYEKGWTLDHAVEYYHGLKKVANYFIENKLYNDIFLALFSEVFFKPKDEGELSNWCGGTGLMISCDPDGYLYPCIRYMESSVGDSIEPYRIGDVDNGLGVTEDEMQKIKCLNCITRRTQSTDKCFYCPVGEGCSWCSAYNYQENGTADKRVEYSCDMHKARALANAYYWPRAYADEGEVKKYKYYLPDSEALKYVSQEELDMIKNHPNIEVIDTYKDYFKENE